MSVITRVSVHTHCNDLGGKVWNPAITWTKKYAVFITIESEHGITGLGECWCLDTSPDVLVAFLKTEICPHLPGLSTDELPGLYTRLLSRATLTARHGLLASAWSGVDIAMWDLRSREARLPLWKYLHTHIPQSSKADGTVYLYASGGLYGKNKTTADLVAEMNSMHAAGFDIVKMKIGGLSVEEDLERVKAVLSSLPDNCKIIIDGVYSYTASQALALFSALPADRIEAFQSPVIAENLSGMTTLREAGVPVMATEAEYRIEIHQQLIDAGAVKYLQTAPLACGGLSRLMQLSNQITQSNDERTQLSLEVSSTAVALLAAAHYATTCDKVAHVEYHYLHQVFYDELTLKPVPNRTGWFQLPQTPGLGIVLPATETHLAYSQA